MRLISPSSTMLGAYAYLSVVFIVIAANGFYKNNSFFSWGPPITFFGKNLTTNTEFYVLQLFIFTHQIINNWVNSVVYPWIINSVQNSSNSSNSVPNIYSNTYTIFLVNLFNIYSEIDVAFIIAGFMSQISFFLTINLANILSSTIINYKHLKAKENYVLREILLE